MITSRAAYRYGGKSLNIVRLGVWGINKSGLVGAYGIIRRYLTGSQAAIIMYHRIGFNKYEWSQPVLDLAAFDRQLAYLKKYFTVLPLQELADRNKERELPVRAIAVTVDDGYKDFYQYAYPLLSKYNLPATIFLTAGHINGDKLFWWDRIRYYITHCQAATIELSDVGMIHLERDLQRKQACEYLINKMIVIDDQKKKNLLQQLKEETRVEEPRGIAKELILNWQEVRQMSANGIEIGAHTMTHPILTNLSLQEAEHEIVLSKNEIENKIQTPVHSFAYPNGIYNSSIRSIVNMYGFKCAVIVGERLVDFRDNSFELPRCAGFEDDNLLKMHLAGCITDLRKVNCLASFFALNS
jgi:peptidoglycan/xylan/chitin deacetylase (PgdA/CDA1 family)